MLNRSASLAMSTSVLKALPGKLDIKRHSPSILIYIFPFYLNTIEWHELAYICTYRILFKSPGEHANTPT